MSLEVISTKLDGVKLIKPTSMFEDFRGFYVETYNKEEYQKAGISPEFVQDDFSCSSRHVLRGIHGDGVTTKLIQCMWGKFYIVIVNNDPQSPQFKQWDAFTLSEHNRLQVLVPPRHGVGHLILSEQAIFSYKQSTYYDRASQFTLKWDDPSLNIWWPIANPILSRRDSGLD
jgi:dTDP-4-dehydrorhamnose 3,5-epimerase